MKAIFKLLATIIGLVGAVQLFLGLFMWDITLLLSGFLSLLQSYGWSYVGDMSEKITELEKRKN